MAKKKEDTGPDPVIEVFSGKKEPEMIMVLHGAEVPKGDWVCCDFAKPRLMTTYSLYENRKK